MPKEYRKLATVTPDQVKDKLNRIISWANTELDKVDGYTPESLDSLDKQAVNIVNYII